MLRYVDDMFGAERHGCEQHAMECVARLVIAILGPGAVAEAKMEFGMPLVVLGISVQTSGFTCSLPAEKLACRLSPGPPRSAQLGGTGSKPQRN